MSRASYMNGRKKYSRPQAMLWSENPGTLTDEGLWVPQGYEIGTDYVASNIPSPILPDSFITLSDHNRQDISFSPTRIEKRERMINGRMRSYHIADKQVIKTSWDKIPSRAFGLNPKFRADSEVSVASIVGDGTTITYTTVDDHGFVSGNTIIIEGSNTTGFNGSKTITKTGLKTFTAEGTAVATEASVGALAIRESAVAGLSAYTGGNGEYTVDGGAGGNEIVDWYENHKGSFFVFLAYDKYKAFGSDDAAYDHLQQYNEVLEMYISSFDYSSVKRGQGNYDLWNISVTLEEV